jgi:hypothetical protein
MKVLKFWAVLALVSLLAIGCGKKSGLEGKVVDGKGQPIANVKVVASQVQPIKGYEQFEATTGSDGSFRFGKLFPSSEYALFPWSDDWANMPMMTVQYDPTNLRVQFYKGGWITDRKMTAQSGPEGETMILPASLTIRFMVSSEGVIADSKTGLEWIVGPDRDANYAQAEQWVANCKVMGGGWRMPTRQELRTIYQQGVGERNMDSAFKTTGYYVWAELRDSSSAWDFNFDNGHEYWRDRDNSHNTRGFGVRSRPQ